MPTDSFGYTGSEQTFTVPQDVQEVIVRLWGAGAGDPGGYVEGTLSVTPGEDLPLYVGGQPNGQTGGWPNGGDGNSASAESDDGVQSSNATSMGGGGSTDIRQGGNTQNDIVGLAGGAGGDGDADAGNASSGGGGSGGGVANDGGDADEEFASADGGHGGESGGFLGGQGSAASQETQNAAMAAAGGGGGGGLNGGGGGGADVGTNDAASGGGGGGDGDTGPLSNTTVTVGGGNTGDGQIEIEYTVPAGTITDITQPSAGDLTIDWDRNDTYSDGTWEIYRSTDGSLGTQIATINDLTTTTYTDTGLGSSEQKFWYTVRRTTPDGKTADDQAVGVVNLAAATNLTTSVSADDITVGWDDNSGVEDGYRVFWRRSSNTSWNNQSSDLAAGSTSYTATGLLDGEEYEFEVETFAGLTESRSATSSPTTTELPDAQQPTLGNGVEDEIAVSWTDVIDYGEYDIEYRETGASTWLTGPTVGEGTTSATITGLEDGEEYEVRLRTQTEHVTGAWTTPVSIVTQFPGAQSLSATSTSPTDVDLSWTDASDNEDGFDVERSNDGGSSWSKLASLSPNTSAYTDSVASSQTAYTYRIRAFTEHSSAYSNTDTATTPASAQPGGPVPASGWHVTIEHPDTGRRIIVTDDILDDPEILPSLNSLPEIRVPVRPDAKWLDPAFENDPPMAVWRDGERTPIDILQEIEDGQEQTVLVGIGGTELRQRVKAEYTAEERYQAADQLITNETTYAADVDNPMASELTDQTQQNPSTTSELSNFITVADTDPIDISNDEVTIFQTCFTQEGEGGTGTAGLGTATDQSGGESAALSSSGEYQEWTFTIGYDVPAGDFDVYARLDTGGAISNEVTWTLNGETVNQSARDQASPVWVNLGSLSSSLPAGTYTLRAEVTSSGASTMFVDVVAPNDGRFSYTFDDTLNASSGYLDGPELHPSAYDVVTNDSTTAFAYVAGAASITIDDTSGNQRLQVSNDRGANYYPNDGTENNTASVDVDPMPTTGAALRMRATLSRYSPSGARNQTPRFGYDAQTLSAYDLSADISVETLLIDEKYDNALWQILNDISGNAKTEYLWSYNLDANGDPQVSWTQPGQRVASTDPDIGDVNIRKIIDTYDRVTVRGRNKPVSSETFNASTSFTALNNTPIARDSEVVYDDTANYERSVDYEMDYSAGEIRATSGGALSAGTNYQIDYDAEREGTYPDPADVPDPDREFVGTIPAAVSNRAATQIAYILFTEYSEPTYSGDLSVPRGDVSFDPLEALTLDNLDLPADATPIDVRGDPQVTPTGIQLRLGDDGDLEQALGAISTQLQSVTDSI